MKRNNHENELYKLAEVLTERYYAMRKEESDGGNPTTSKIGALIAMREIIKAIYVVIDEPFSEHQLMIE